MVQKWEHSLVNIKLSMISRDHDMDGWPLHSKLCTCLEISSVRFCADSMCLCLQKINNNICLLKILYPFPSSVDYGNTKITQLALKASIFRLVKLYTTWKNKKNIVCLLFQRSQWMRDPMCSPASCSLRQAPAPATKACRWRCTFARPLTALNSLCCSTTCVSCASSTGCCRCRSSSWLSRPTLSSVGDDSLFSIVFICLFSVVFICLFSVVFICLFSIAFICLFSIVFTCLFSIVFMCLFSIVFTCMFSIVLVYLALSLPVFSIVFTCVFSIVHTHLFSIVLACMFSIVFV